MNTIECMETRRSIRVFKTDRVSHDILEKVIGAASYAPSWKNSQTTRYIAVEDRVLISKIAKECCGERNGNIIKDAPLLIVATLIQGRSGFERDGSFSTSKQDHWQYYDAGIAGGIFSLAAHEVGLSCTILGIFDDRKIADLLHIPEDQEVMALIPTGYANETPSAPPRKAVADLLSYRS